MNPTVIEGKVIPVGKPAGWDDERQGRCGTLMVRLDQAEGLNFMTSAWEPSPEEIGFLLAGAKIHLGISAASHPVVRMGHGPVPETDAGPVWTIRPLARLDGKRVLRVQGFTGKGYAWAEVEDQGNSRSHDVAVGMASVEERLKEAGFL